MTKKKVRMTMNDEVTKPEEIQDAAVRTEEVAAYQSQLDAPLSQQPQSGCPAASDMFRAPTENLGDVKER